MAIYVPVHNTSFMNGSYNERWYPFKDYKILYLAKDGKNLFRVALFITPYAFSSGNCCCRFAILTSCPKMESQMFNTFLEIIFRFSKKLNNNNLHKFCEI